MARRRQAAGLFEFLKLLQNQVVVVLLFFGEVLHLLGELFQVIRARAVVHGGLVQLVLQIADALFQRLEAFALRGLHINQILDPAVDLVNLLLRRRILRARDAGRESGEGENKKPKRNLSHAPKINLCAAASSRVHPRSPIPTIAATLNIAVRNNPSHP